MTTLTRGTSPLPATMTVSEAAQFLGINLQTAYRLAARGDLPGARRLGGRIVVSRDALDRFLNGTQPATGVWYADV